MKAALRTIVLQGNNHLSLSGYYYRKEGNTGFYDDITINVCLIENHKQQKVIMATKISVIKEALTVSRSDTGIQPTR